MNFYNALTDQTVETQQWQLDLAPGDYYLIANPSAAVGDEEFTAPTIYGYVENVEPPMRGYLFVRGFSRWCPGGELGTMCIVDPTRKLTKEEFEAARDKGWPIVSE